MRNLLPSINKEELRHTFQLSLPIIIGQIGSTLMGVADTIMVGRLGSESLAAAGVANGIYFLISVIGMGIVLAVSPIVSKTMGEGRAGETGNIFRAGLSAAVLSSLVLIIPMSIVADNFHWLKQENAEVARMGSEFLWIVTPSLLPMLLFMAMKQFSDGLEIVLPAMFITIGGLLMNVILNFLLIWGLGPFDAMGLNGAGIATVISRVAMVLAMILVMFLNVRLRAAARRRPPKQKNPFFREVFKVGLPTGMQFFFEVAAFGGAAIIIGWIGAAQQAAHQIALNPASVTYMIVSGLASAGAIRVGNALGIRSKEGIRKAANSAFTIATLFMGFTCLLFLFGRDLIVFLYMDASAEPQVAAIASSLLLVAAIFQLSDGIQCVGLGVLRGIQDVKIPTAITMIAYWVIGIPLGCLFAFTLDWGVYGIWAGLTLGLTFSAVAQTLRFYYLLRKIDLN